MSWSYNSDEPGASPKDEVRFEIQDINEKAPLLEDGEILFALTQEGEVVLAAAARCCEVLSRRFAEQADTQFGSVKATYSKQAAVFAERAKEIRERSQAMHAPFAGGISRSEKRADRRNKNRVDIPFRVGQFRNPFRERGW